MPDTHGLRLLPVPSRITVIAREATVANASTEDGKTISIWYQSFPLVIGVAGGALIAGLAQAPDAGGVSVCRTICQARARQMHRDLSLDIPAYVLDDGSPDGPEIRLEDDRAAWLALLRMAGERCPERQDDIDAFIADEKRRLALVDTYLKRPDIGMDFLEHAWQTVTIDSLLDIKKLLFSHFDPYVLGSWPVQDRECDARGGRYRIQIRNRQKAIASIDYLQSRWRAHGPRVPDRADHPTLGDAIAWCFDELRAHLLEHLSGHEILAEIPVLDRITDRFGSEDAFCDLFLPFP